MKNKRMISLLLCLVMVFSTQQAFEVFAQSEFSSNIAVSEETEDIENFVASGKTTVIACSDFQAESGNDAGAIQLQSLLDSIVREGIASADGFFCCGDYDYEYSETKQGIDTIKETINSVVNQNMVFVQGSINK